MTITELRKLKPGTEVRWTLEPSPNGHVRIAEPLNKKSARWLEWPDGQRTEDYDDWALAHVEVD